MKNKYFTYAYCVFTMAIILFSCADITDTQREFLDRGEENYVGVIDDLTVYGGKGRVVIEGKDTYLRNAKQCVVKRVNIEGESDERIFEIKDVLKDHTITMNIENVPEGDYDFYVYTVDNYGNKSLELETFGSSYGDKYKRTASPLSIIKLSVAGEIETLNLSTSKMAKKCIISYKDKQGNNQEKEVLGDEISNPIQIEGWEDSNLAEFKIQTFILPEDKSGLDTLELDPITQITRKECKEYTINKDELSYIELTKWFVPGTAFGAAGGDALFDGAAGGQFWSEDSRKLGHFCIDMSRGRMLTEVDIVGRIGYPGWDVVKFELWGREDISDGPDGDTGYCIEAEDTADDFEAEAIRRQWKKIGNGWFKYDRPRKDPQESHTVLTNTINDFSPRYIMFKVISVLTPGLVPVPDTDDYYGTNGGYPQGSERCSFNISELSFNADGFVYSFE